MNEEEFALISRLSALVVVDNLIFHFIVDFNFVLILIYLLL